MSVFDIDVKFCDTGNALLLARGFWRKIEMEYTMILRPNRTINVKISGNQKGGMIQEFITEFPSQLEGILTDIAEARITLQRVRQYFNIVGFDDTKLNQILSSIYEIETSLSDFSISLKVETPPGYLDSRYKGNKENTD